jgi:hypothetical protein
MADPFQQMYQQLQTTPCPAPMGQTTTVGCNGLNVPCLTFDSGILVDGIDRPLIINPSDLQPQGASIGDIISWNGTIWVPKAESNVRAEQVGINMIGNVGVALTGIPIGLDYILPVGENPIFAIHLNDLTTNFMPSQAMLSVVLTNPTGNAAEPVYLQVMAHQDPTTPSLGNWTVFGPQVPLHGLAGSGGIRVATSSITGLPASGVLYLQLVTTTEVAGYNAAFHSVNLTMYQ